MLNPTYVISADLGTQGTKTALVDNEGEIIATSLQPTRLIRKTGGSVEQDPMEMLHSVVAGIKEVMEISRVKGGSIVAIGLSGQMAGVLGIDRDGNAVTPYDSWLDTRCESYFQTIKSWGEEAYIEVTGCPVTYAHGPKILWWKHERSEVYSSISRFVLPTTFVALSLTGGRADDAYIDYTHLHFSGFAEVEHNKWSEPLLKAFGVNADKMPRIVSPWESIGKLIPQFAALCGLPSGIPVVAGCGDTAATTLGAGITAKGMVFDVAGTASVLSCCVDVYRPDTRHKTLIYPRSVLPGLWTPLAYINGGGQCLAWFREQLASGGDAPSFTELNQGAEAIVPGSDNLFFIPHFGGRVCPNNSLLRGAWFGLNWSHDKYAMHRSIMESIAYEYKMYLDILKQSVPGLSCYQIRVVGGGARGDIFNKIKADVLGVPYATLRTNDTSHLANAAIAGYGVGLFTGIAETVGKWAKIGRVFEPNADNQLAYQRVSSKYPKLLEQMEQVQRTIMEEKM